MRFTAAGKMENKHQNDQKPIPPNNLKAMPFRAPYKNRHINIMSSCIPNNILVYPRDKPSQFDKMDHSHLRFVNEHQEMANIQCASGDDND